MGSIYKAWIDQLKLPERRIRTDLATLADKRYAPMTFAEYAGIFTKFGDERKSPGEWLTVLQECHAEIPAWVESAAQVKARIAERKRKQAGE